jgi:transcriptional regulator with XRE-family HTH domain
MDAISSSQCRAARALLDWTREQLSAASGVPERTLADFEAGATNPREATLAKLAAAFGEAGIAFVTVHGATGGVILLNLKPPAA